MKPHADLLAEHAKASALRAEAHADAVAAIESKLNREKAAFAKDLAAREAAHTEALRSRYRDLRKQQFDALRAVLAEHFEERSFKSARAVGTEYQKVHAESVSQLGTTPGILLAIAMGDLLEADRNHGVLGQDGKFFGGHQGALNEVCARTERVASLLPGRWR